jgi:hypothetical protein
MLIGISGKLGSGKNTVADIIQKIMHKTYSLELKAYADKLKQITSLMTGVSLESCYTQEGKNIFLPEWQMTVGEFQQKIGTEGMRNGVHPNAWIYALFANYNEKSNWIVTDVRFPNEAKAIKKRKGLLVRVEGDPAKIRENSTRNLSHPSETSLDSWKPWDYMIDNSGTLAQLKEQVEYFTEIYF